MASAKKTTQSQTEETVEAPEAPAGAFESFIKDGPSQDDLNPAYAPPKDEGKDGKDSDDSTDGDK